MKKRIPSYTKYSRLAKKTGLSERAICKDSGVPRSSMYGWKNGSTISDANIEKLAGFLKVSKDDLMKNA